MPSFQFIGQYLGRSKNVGTVRYVNLFPHQTQDGRMVAFGTPGTVRLAQLGGLPIRGMLVMGDYLYIATGTAFYRMDSTYAVTQVGTLDTASGNVQMASNGQQLIIVDGSYGYIWTPGTSTFAKITSAAFPAASSVCFLDGYFIVNAVNTNTFFYSGLYDGFSWNALDYNAAEAAPDNVVGVLATFGFLYVFGQYTTELWYDAGDPLSVFRRADGMVNNVGLLAPASAAKVGDTGNMVCWLATSNAGRGYVVASAGGSQTQRISTPEIEYLWAQYETLSDAVAYGYTTEGHTFYVLTFPTANTTWVYDFQTQAWHERSTNGGRHVGQNYAFFTDIHVIGSGLDGSVYQMHMDTYDDAGLAIQRTLISPTMGDDDTGLVSYLSMQVDMERGMGLPSGQGSDPKLMLAWSDDSGHSWCDEIMGGIGQQGNYTLRVIFRRLGRSFRRTWRVRISDPVKVVIQSAVIKTRVS